MWIPTHLSRHSSLFVSTSLSLCNPLRVEWLAKAACRRQLPISLCFRFIYLLYPIFVAFTIVVSTHTRPCAALVEHEKYIVFIVCENALNRILMCILLFFKLCHRLRFAVGYRVSVDICTRQNRNNYKMKCEYYCIIALWLVLFLNELIFEPNKFR